MSTLPYDRDELDDLLDAFCCQALTPAGAERLAEILRADAQARCRFLEYMDLHAALLWEISSHVGHDVAGLDLPAGDQAASSDPAVTHAAPPPSPLPGLEPPRSPVLGFLGDLMGPLGGSPMLRFVLWAAAGLFGSGLLVLLVVLAVGALTDHSVARLTAGVNCHWRDADAAPDRGGRIPAGRTLELTAGVADITFDHGARVLLEAPATFRIETDNAASLKTGKLVGWATKEAAGFSVDTPSGKVVDLGTEFAVEVAPNGRMETHVLSGRVALEPHAATAEKPKTEKPKTEKPAAAAAPARIELGQGGAAAVETNLAVRRMAAQPVRFLTELPAAFTFHNTGAGLGPGQADPHWLIVATSTDKNFKPRAAEVVRPGAAMMNEYRERASPHLFGVSQYIAGSADAPYLKPYTTWTFRTTFDLDGFDPATARLEGWFFADDKVQEIRLNGRLCATPKDAWTAYPLRIDEGFVAGKNTMEWVVWNAGFRRHGPSPIALRVELQGYAKQK